MKRILSIAFALAFAGTLLSGCDRNETNRPAGSGATGTTPSTPSSPSAPAEKPEQQKRGTQSPTKP